MSTVDTDTTETNVTTTNTTATTTTETNVTTTNTTTTTTTETNVTTTTTTTSSSQLVSTNEEPEKQKVLYEEEEPPPPYSVDDMVADFLEGAEVADENKNDVEDMKMTVSLMPDDNKNVRVMMSIVPPESKERTPCDVCVVVDVSGSMGSDATIQNDKGGVESKGFSILDIVKHSVRVIINILNDNDRLSLVVFSSQGKTIFELTQMDAKGRKKAEKELSLLQPGGNTNIWGGLSAGLDTLDKGKDKGNVAHLLLLTDGEPNVVPPRGHLPMLNLYKKKHPDLSFTVNTFGFGYSLDSKLLYDFSANSDGIYSFIPDSGFVGTVFVNAISNLLVTVARNACVSFKLQNGAELVEDGVLGGLSVTEEEGTYSIRLGTMQSGQAREVVLRMTVPEGSSGPYITSTLTCDQSGKDQPVTLEVKDNNEVDSGNIDIEVATCRLSFIDVVSQLMDEWKNDQDKVRADCKKLSDSFEKSPAKKDERLKALVKDVTGQVSLAFSKKEYYDKWGIHYLPSLMRAHLLHQCNNFKDPGVALYGGKVFTDVRDEADEMFLKLPPATPSNTYLLKQTKTKKSARRTQTVNMHAYYNVSGGCVSGESLILMGDGSKKKVKSVQKGDHVLCGSSKVMVECVVKFNCHLGFELVKFESGLCITPWHPVKMNDKWTFPYNLANKTIIHESDSVYNFILSDGHVMTINDIECVSLGHKFQEDVVAHPYFGSSKILLDLEKLPGWPTGLVELNTIQIQRDESGHVCGILPFH